MKWSRMISVVGAHAEGEVGRVIVGGVLDVPGGTTAEKLSYLQHNDGLRQFVNNEPRGCAQMTTNLLLPATHPGADVAFIPMQADGTHAMSGSNAMCVATVLLETGTIPMEEPESRVVLDTAAGLVIAIAKCREGRVENVTLEMFPAFATDIDVPLEVEGVGTIHVDVAFGGAFYVLPEVRQLGLSIEPGAARDMVEIGAKIMTAATEQISVSHPRLQGFDQIEFLMFTDVVDAGRRVFRNATIMPPGRVDRSPCGTGSAARMAAMYAKGEISLNQKLHMLSTIGSHFGASIVSTADVGGRPGIVPRISGRAWIYAVMELGCDPSDPFSSGYTMADTWGTGIEHEFPDLQTVSSEE